MDSEITRLEKLQNGDTWPQWKFQIKVMLKASDLYDVVSGDVIFPVVSRDVKIEDLPAAIKTWKQLDNKAQKIIVTAVGSEPLTHIMSCETSHEMWSRLCSVYERKM